MKRAIRIVSVIFLAAMLSACSMDKIKEIKVNSFKIEQISPRSLRSLEIIVSAEVDNPAMAITADSLSGKISRLSEEIGTLDAEHVFLEGNSVSDIRIKTRLSLSRNVSMIDVLGYVAHFNVNDYTVDARGYVKLGKKKKGQLVEIKDKPLSRLITIIDEIQPDHIQNR